MSNFMSAHLPGATSSVAGVLGTVLASSGLTTSSASSSSSSANSSDSSIMSGTIDSSDSTPWFDPFVDVGSLNLCQLCFLGCVYGYLLCQGSELISNGSELLLLVPSMANIVGSVVLPVLGAVPDGVMVLVSGMGKQAQQEIFVGLGTMAGSTVMLLTVVWFVSVLGGAVDYDTVSGRLNYKKPADWNEEVHGEWEKHSTKSSIWNSAIQVRPAIRDNVKYMLGTLIPLIVVQFGAFKRNSMIANGSGTDEEIEAADDLQQYYVFAGLILSALGYIWYLYGQYLESEDSEFVNTLQLDAIQFALKTEMLTLEGALGEVAKLDKYYGLFGSTTNPTSHNQLHVPLLGGAGHGSHHGGAGSGGSNCGGSNSGKPDRENSKNTNGGRGSKEGSHSKDTKDSKDGSRKDEGSAITNSSQMLYTKLQQVLRPYFKKYDTNGDGGIDFEEFRVICAEVSSSATKEAQLAIFQQMDVDQNGSLSFEEFVECMLTLTRKAQEIESQVFSESTQLNLSGTTVTCTSSEPPQASENASESDQDDEQEDVPFELAHLSPAEQQRRIKVKSLWQCSLGTLMIVIFSDPMVDVLNNLAQRINVPSFFVSFVLSPVVSNASELIAAWNYAKKKTIKSATISLSTCEGAACMNNTFCLFCFLFCMWWGRLEWNFTMETSCVVLVELLMAIIAMRSLVHTVASAYLVLSLYIIALIFVYTGEHVFGFS